MFCGELLLEQLAVLNFPKNSASKAVATGAVELPLQLLSSQDVC